MQFLIRMTRKLFYSMFLVLQTFLIFLSAGYNPYKASDQQI